MTAVKTHMSTVEVEDGDTVYSESLHEPFKHQHSLALAGMLLALAQT